MLVLKLSKRLKSIGKDAGLIGSCDSGKYPSEVDVDGTKLPPGFKRTGYDADEQRYYFCDTSDNSTWVGRQGEEFGTMTRCNPMTGSPSNGGSSPKSSQEIQLNRSSDSYDEEDDETDPQTAGDDETQAGNSADDEIDFDFYNRTASSQQKHDLARQMNEKRIDADREARLPTVEAFKENVSSMLGRWKTAVDPVGSARSSARRPTLKSNSTELGITRYVPVASRSGVQFIPVSPPNPLQRRASSRNSNSAGSDQASSPTPVSSSLKDCVIPSPIYKHDPTFPSSTFSSGTSVRRNQSHVLPLSAMASPPHSTSTALNSLNSSAALSVTSMRIDRPQYSRPRPKYR